VVQLGYRSWTVLRPGKIFSTKNIAFEIPDFFASKKNFLNQLEIAYYESNAPQCLALYVARA
jgi:hypothetical protein